MSATPSAWRCATCQIEFVTFEAARRHAARFRHRRVDWLPR